MFRSAIDSLEPLGLRDIRPSQRGWIWECIILIGTLPFCLPIGPARAPAKSCVKRSMVALCSCSCCFCCLQAMRVVWKNDILFRLGNDAAWWWIVEMQEMIDCRPVHVGAIWWRNSRGRCRQWPKHRVHTCGWSMVDSSPFLSDIDSKMILIRKARIVIWE